MSIDSTPLPHELFELDPEILWVMHCAEGPMPRLAAQAIREFVPRETQPWTLRWQEDFQDIPKRTREQAAQLIGAETQNVTLTTTTSSGLMAVAQGFEWHEGDEIVTPIGEFPSNSWPWLALASRGVTLRRATLWPGHRAGKEAWESTPPTAEDDIEANLLAALSPRTRMLAISWVRFQDGLKLDLGRLAHGCAERGVELIVDGIQGTGTQEVDLTGVSAFATGGHKGLLAPQGLGFLWTESRFRQQLMPCGTWLSVEDATDFRRPSTDLDRAFLEGGIRLEPGSPNLLGCVALEAALKTLNEAGIDHIDAHIARLRDRLIQGLREIPAWRGEAERLQTLNKAGRLASIVALHHAGRGAQAYAQMLDAWQQKGIYASVREGYFRIALHGYHRKTDIDRILNALA